MAYSDTLGGKMYPRFKIRTLADLPAKRWFETPAPIKLIGEEGQGVAAL